MKFVLPLAMSFGALIAFGQTAGQTAISGEELDESVVPQWSATFPVLLKASETQFLSFRMAKQPSGPLSDADLINGATTQTPSIPRLQGAQECKTERDPDTVVGPSDGLYSYKCSFPHGRSAAEMQNDFVRLVRLVEKATGETAVQVIAPSLSQYSEHRIVHVGRIGVAESWFSDSPLSRLEIRIHPAIHTGYRPPTASSPGRSEIDGIIKSGRYTQMPAAQRVGSSGSGPASIKVTNDTAYSLTVVYEGISSRTLIIPAHDTTTIQLPAGSFRVLGRVSAPGVLPFIGSENLGPGDNLESNFFIK
jgi:hypothetical protein